MADSADKRPIERDPTFSRHNADMGYAYVVHSGLELVFIATGPELSEGEDDENSQKRAIYAEEARSEVARVRIGPAPAIFLAIDTLREAVSRPGLRLEKVRDDLEELIESINQKITESAKASESKK